MRQSFAAPAYAMYSLRLLGGISLEGPSGPLSGRVVQHRQLAVLAVLAMIREKGCSRDRLVGYVWPESPGERARHLLADSIYLLRRSLGDDVVTASGDVLRINTDVVWTDAVAFRENLERGDLEAAVELYGGPFLDGFFADGSPEFEHWVEAERRDLADRYAAALETLAADAEERGDLTQAAVWWRRLAAHDPFNSRVVLRLMKALVAVGDPANAIQIAQEHELNLKTQLDLDPPPELADFVERLKKGTLEGEPIPDATAPTAPTAMHPSEGPAAEPVKARGIGRLARRHRLAVAALAVLTILAIAAVTRQLLTKNSTEAKRRSIAVLPFENLTGDPENDYIAAGFHEELISQLFKIGDVRVIARSSVMEYGDNPRSLRTVAEELDVDHILEASLRAEGERLRITVQLLDPESGGHIWAESYDRLRGDLLDVQLDIALRIAENLSAHLKPEELARIEARPTDNRDAYDFYLRGVHFEEDRIDRRAAIQMYERAIELDSTFALAYARMASARSILYRWFMDRTDDHLTKAGLAVERALELQPDLLEAHLALYNFRSAQLDRPGAMEALAQARALAPNDPRVHRWLGLALRQTGRFEESAEYLDRALEYSPRWRSLLYNAATTALYRRDYSAAQSYLNRGFEVSPDDGSFGEAMALLHANWDGDLEKAWQGYQIYCQRRNPRLPNPTMSHWRALARILHPHYQEALRQHTLMTFGPDTLRYFYLKALSYQLTDELGLAHAYADSGRAVMEDHLARTADDDPLQDQRYRHGYLAYFYALLGRHDEAIQQAETGVRLLSDSVSAIQAPIRVGTLAEVYVMVDEHEAAIAQLEHLLSVPSCFSARQFELDPIWDPLREHPRFLELLERYGGRGGSISHARPPP